MAARSRRARDDLLLRTTPTISMFGVRLAAAEAQPLSDRRLGPGRIARAIVSLTTATGGAAASSCQRELPARHERRCRASRSSRARRRCGRPATSPAGSIAPAEVRTLVRPVVSGHRADLGGRHPAHAGHGRQPSVSRRASAAVRSGNSRSSPGRARTRARGRGAGRARPGRDCGGSA